MISCSTRSKAGLPVVCIPGCPAQPDNMTETLLYLALHLAGLAPVPELDEAAPTINAGEMEGSWIIGDPAGSG